MKGLGILLVMYYHSAPHFPIDLTIDPLVSTISYVINTFFMQIFFFCSGFLMILSDLKKTPTDDKKNRLGLEKYLQRRFIRLMIPYFTFAIISVLLRVLLGAITRSDISLVEGLINIFIYAKYFWFLFVLFVITIFFNILRIITSKWSLWIVFGLILSFLSYIKPIELFHLDRICYFSLFVILGGVAAVFRNKISFLRKNKYLCLFAFLYMYLLYVLSELNEGLGKYIIEISTSMCAILFIYSCSYKLIKSALLFKILKYFSNYSLQYYLFQDLLCLPIYYCVLMFHIPSAIISVVTIFILLVTFSFVCLHICIRIPCTSMFLGLKK